MIFSNLKQCIPTLFSFSTVLKNSATIVKENGRMVNLLPYVHCIYQTKVIEFFLFKMNILFVIFVGCWQYKNKHVQIRRLNIFCVLELSRCGCFLFAIIFFKKSQKNIAQYDYYGLLQIVKNTITIILYSEK